MLMYLTAIYIYIMYIFTFIFDYFVNFESLEQNRSLKLIKHKLEELSE